MDEYQKQIIQQNFNTLANGTNLFIFDKLRARNIPVPNKEPNALEWKKKLYRDIQNCGNRSFYLLIDALKESGNSVLAKILEDGERIAKSASQRKRSSEYTFAQTDAIGKLPAVYPPTVKPPVLSHHLKTPQIPTRQPVTPQIPTRQPATPTLLNQWRKESISQQISSQPIQYSPVYPNKSLSSARNIQQPQVKFQPTTSTGVLHESSRKTSTHSYNENSQVYRPPGGLQIKVRAAVQFLDDPKSKIVPYPMRSIHRGVLLLINNIKFENNNERRGADVDEDNLVELFKQLGFVIFKYRNLKFKEMNNLIKNFTGKKNRKLKNFDCCFVIVSSHGNSGKSSQETLISTSDNKNIGTPWIIEQFTGKHCRALLGKPKVLLFNSCRGSSAERGVSAGPTEVDGKPTGKEGNISSQSDMLLGYSTIPGYVSTRDIHTGSWYIRTLCETFMDHAHDTDVEQMLKMASLEINQLKSSQGDMQTPTVENRCFRTCFLHPNLRLERNMLVSGQLRGYIDTSGDIWIDCTEDRDNTRKRWGGGCWG